MEFSIIYSTPEGVMCKENDSHVFYTCVTGPGVGATIFKVDQSDIFYKVYAYTQQDPFRPDVPRDIRQDLTSAFWTKNIILGADDTGDEKPAIPYMLNAGNEISISYIGSTPWYPEDIQPDLQNKFLGIEKRVMQVAGELKYCTLIEDSQEWLVYPRPKFNHDYELSNFILDEVWQDLPEPCDLAKNLRQAYDDALNITVTKFLKEPVKKDDIDSFLLAAMATIATRENAKMALGFEHTCEQYLYTWTEAFDLKSDNTYYTRLEDMEKCYKTMMITAVEDSRGAFSREFFKSLNDKLSTGFTTDDAKEINNLWQVLCSIAKNEGSFSRALHDRHVLECDAYNIAQTLAKSLTPQKLYAEHESKEPASPFHIYLVETVSHVSNVNFAKRIQGIMFKSYLQRQKIDNLVFKKCLKKQSDYQSFIGGMRKVYEKCLASI